MGNGTPGCGRGDPEDRQMGALCSGAAVRRAKGKCSPLGAESYAKWHVPLWGGLCAGAPFKLS